MLAGTIQRWLAVATLLAFGGSSCSQTTTSSPAARPAETEETEKPAITKTFNFEEFPVGKTPEGFSTALTGGSGPVSWVIVEDPTAPAGQKVLAQTSTDKTDYRFPVCIYDGLQVRDVEVAVRFKAVSGKVDRAAGLVVRYKDKDNYYVVRANALEDNVRLYKVVDGKRQQFAGANAKVTSDRWHSLKLEAKGSHFEVYYDDKPLFEADDSTFADAGKVGLWTKADSVTYFDDLRIEGVDPRRNLP